MARSTLQLASVMGGWQPRRCDSPPRETPGVLFQGKDVADQALRWDLAAGDQVERFDERSLDRVDGTDHREAAIREVHRIDLRHLLLESDGQEGSAAGQLGIDLLQQAGGGVDDDVQGCFWVPELVAAGLPSATGTP